MVRVRVTIAAAIAALGLAVACGSDDDDGGSGGAAGNSGSSGSSGSSGTAGTGGGTAGTGGGTAGTGGGGVTPAPTQDDMGVWTCYAADGSSHLCACNDNTDNDNDQTTDLLDPNCLGIPFTDSEAGTAGGGTCGTTACTNCLDDDDDGVIDGADAECTGALDNDEGSFATGIPGDNTDACKQDCFFDGNSGSGNDGCLWDLRCDPESPGANATKPCPYDDTYNNCPTSQSAKCLNTCAKYTPNGCDCFGCCEVFVDGVSHTVKLGPGCTTENIGECPSCTQTDTCINDCGECEYCLGKEPPAECFPDPDAGTPEPDAGPPPAEGQCPTGYDTCVPGSTTCGPGFYCLTGCCVPAVQ